MLYRCFSFLRAGLFWKVAAGVVFLCVLAGGLSGLVFAAGAEAPSAPALISDLEDAGEAEDVIVTDLPDETDVPESEDMAQTEPLLETEAVYEIPAALTESLKKDTPVGQAAEMTLGECNAFVQKIFRANSAKALWKRHANVSATFRLFETESQMWKEYSCFYADPMLYYSDDWTPGLEELRLLIRGENECVEDYTRSMRFVRFLNASGQPYRNPAADPVTLSADTPDELLLLIHAADDTLFVVTQLTEPSIAGLGLEEPGAGSFYSCTYLLDPETLDLRMLQIALHDAGDPAEGASDGDTDRHSSDGAAASYVVTELRNITYSYDHGMTPFVETGCRGLLRHMDPEKVWEEEDLRTVTVTLDPKTEEEQVYTVSVLKGDPVACTLPEGYTLFSDEALTIPWVDNGDYASDLFLWAAADPADSVIEG